ncbi:MAG: hypothetical protein WD530_02555 [Vicingaceae bacterium]
MMLKKFHFILFASLFALFACENNRWNTDVSTVSVHLNPQRFDLKLHKLSGQTFDEASWSQLNTEFPNFAKLYLEGIMQFGKAGESEAIYTFNRFLNDEDIQGLLEDVAESYPENSLKNEFEQLEKGFQYYKHYFPDRSIPELRTFVSAFTFSTVASDSVLGLGLDMYMGGDYEIYPKIGIPQYKFINFSRAYLVSDALKAWLISEFESPGAKNLLEQMVEQGKVLYLLEAFLQDTEDHVFMNYSKEDLSWCETNEDQIWFHFIEMELLHTSENNQIRKYMGDAPFIAGFPEGSPGRVGQWVGWQIVSAYMEKNKHISLAQLMQTQDADLILQQSNYKPKK